MCNALDLPILLLYTFSLYHIILIIIMIMIFNVCFCLVGFNLTCISNFSFLQNFIKSVSLVLLVIIKLLCIQHILKYTAPPHTLALTILAVYYVRVSSVFVELLNFIQWQTKWPWKLQCQKIYKIVQT